MEQARLIRGAFLASVAVALVGAPREPEETIVKSLLDVLTPSEPSLKSLRELSMAEADFRGCDRDGNHVYDFWTFDVAGLYQMKTLPPADAPANDRDWCHVSDFWTANVGLYGLSTDLDGAIKLIEL